jgi:type IV pilus modification protein PilV
MRIENVGQTLIEISVVLLLISITFTATLGTMLKAQQLSYQATQRADVLNIASNMSNDMQLNKHELLDLKGAYFTNIYPQKNISLQCVVSRNCLYYLQAQQDILNWKNALALKVPYYQAIICRDDTPRDGKNLDHNGCDNNLLSPVAIKIWWSNHSRQLDLELFLARVHSL